MIAVVDYGMGNLRSVAKALERVGAEVCVSSEADRITSADAVVLPGVGAFGRCMENLRAAGLVETVRTAALSGKPFLGVCVGMQILFDESEEFGPVAGLGILSGRVRRFSSPQPDLKIPHMGWNRIELERRGPLFIGVPDGAYVYFVHSYYVECSDPAIVSTRTRYGVGFASSIGSGRLFATQFHPEKSQALGLRLLENFAALAAGKELAP